MERTGVITFRGAPLTLLGTPLAAGAKAPDFSLQANDLSPRSLRNYRGKALLLSIVPSLDTEICNLQTRRFNREASSWGNSVQI